MQWVPFSETALRSMRESNARLNIWEGAVRSSKTVCSILRWLKFISNAPAGPLLMTGKTERTLTRNILDPIAEMIGASRISVNAGSGEAMILGRRIYLAGANDLRAEQKIRGLTLAGAYGDELTLWPESFFRMLLSRLSVPGAAFFGTTNPDTPHHWLKRDFIDRARELDLKTFRFRLSDNLSLHPDYIRNLEAEYTGLWRRRFIEGAWVMAEGAVYDMFDTRRHVVEYEPEAISNGWIGVDYGTTNPTVFLYLVQAQDGRLFVLDEWRHDPAKSSSGQKTDIQFSAALKGFLNGKTVRFVYIDPSAASFRLQVFRDGVKNAAAADNAVLDGIREVASFLSAGRLLIHSRCRGLIDELSGYVWDQRAQERGEDTPRKLDDHGPDALRYAIRGSRQYWNR